MCVIKISWTFEQFNFFSDKFSKWLTLMVFSEFDQHLTFTFHPLNFAKFLQIILI